MLVKVPLAAVALSVKLVLPPLIKLLIVPAVLVKVPFPALEVSENRVNPENPWPPLFVKVPLPADELLKNSV